MKAEAIKALELFKEQHLARMPEQAEDDKVSEQHSVQKPKRQKGVNFNYPDHYKPLKDRILSGLANGCRTPESVANYCGTTDVKLINLQLGRWVSRGMIGRQTNKQSGITRYYPHDIAKEMGILTKPQPILRKKKAKPTQKREQTPRQMPLWNETASDLATAEQLMQHEALKKHCTFLENQVRGWQSEARKQAHEIAKLQDELRNTRKTRDVTSEIAEVMEEVTKLRATVAYLESKLFGSK
jgi:hypothetical protein